MTSDDRDSSSNKDHDASVDQRGEIVQSTVPEARPDVIDIPDSDPHNPTPSENAARLQQEVTGGLIPDNEDG